MFEIRAGWFVAFAIAIAAVGTIPSRAGAAVTAAGSGYRVVADDGAVYGFAARQVKSASLTGLRGAIVGVASTPGGSGYWLAGSDGGVFAYGDARFYGSRVKGHFKHPVVGIAATPTGRGYWLVGSDGGVFAYGDARFYGSGGRSRFNGPVVGIAATPTGHGYWLAGTDGGVFAYGDARFYGSRHRTGYDNGFVVGIAATPTGHGYWLVGTDGGVFAYGDARFYGSGGRSRFNSAVVGIAATRTGHGYWLVGEDGGVFAYGDARFHGSAAAVIGPRVAARRVGHGRPVTVTVPVAATVTTGYDISWPQCGGRYPGPPYAVAVVGLNNGRMYTRNPCLASEAAWAGRALSLYVNVDGLPHDETSGLVGPRGRCAAGDVLCRSYNYGRNAVAYDVAYAQRLGISSSMWWLDVEVEPIWRKENPASNTEVIKGLLDGLRAHGFGVGIYSTNYQWKVITGGRYRPGTPIWVAGASNLPEAKAYCSPSHAFGGGKTRLSQWTTLFDHDYAC